MYIPCKAFHKLDVAILNILLFWPSYGQKTADTKLLHLILRLPHCRECTFQIPSS